MSLQRTSNTNIQHLEATSVHTMQKLGLVKLHVTGLTYFSIFVFGSFFNPVKGIIVKGDLRHV